MVLRATRRMAAAMSLFLDLLFREPVFYFAMVFAMIASIVLHELGHGLVATWEGDPTPRLTGHITWNPVVHMGWLSLVLVAVAGLGWGATPVDRRAFRHRRWGEVLVSGAGPFVNLSLAVLGAVLFVLVRRSGDAQVPSAVPVFWLAVLQVNVLLFLVNVLPLPPFDGFSVAEGLFDLGEFGAFLRRAGFLPLIVAILIVNSQPFGHLIDATTGAMLRIAGALVGG